MNIMLTVSYEIDIPRDAFFHAKSGVVNEEIMRRLEIINGEPVTGVTTMRMDEGLDTGDMILKTEVPLKEGETGGTLFGRLAEAGAELCVKTLDAIAQGTAVYTPQDHDAATHTTIIKKQLGEMDWAKPAVELECFIRGMDPWPSAYTYLDGKTLKIWKARVQGLPDTGQGVTGTAQENQGAAGCRPGTILAVARDAISVQTGQGALILEELQLEGKKRMSAEAFLRGFALAPGKELGKKFKKV